MRYNLGGKVVIAGARMQLRPLTTSASPFLFVHPLEATMKKILLLCGMILAISATVASAGVDLAWDNCRGGGGLASKAFACNTNTGTSSTLVASVKAPAGIELWNSFEAEYYFGFSGNQPAWWQLRTQGAAQPNQCRNNSISANSIGAGLAGCTDAYNGNGAGGIGTYQNGPNIPAGEDFPPTPNVARLLLVFAIPAGNESPLTTDEDYFVAKVVINNAKTVNSACTGCALPACVLLSGVKAGQPAGSPGGNPEVHGGSLPGSDLALWNASDLTSCPGQVSTRRSTWGGIKSLYR